MGSSCRRKGASSGRHAAPCPSWSRRVTAGAALLLLLCSASYAAVDYEKEFRWDIWYDQLTPASGHKHRHDFWYQVPENPRGAVLFAHGCVHSGYNYWPQSEACPECRGLPEEMSHTLQALRRGYAVITISSLDRKTGCFAFWEDCFDVADIVTEWREEWGLNSLPLYGFGVSAGGAFLLKLPRYLKLDGVVSEALGIDPASGGYRDIKDVYPPAMFISMQRDDKQVELIKVNQQILRERGGAAEIIEVYPRQVYPTYFSDRSPYYIDEKLSMKIWQGLKKIGMIDGEGNVLEDPRYTPRPWLKELQGAVPELAGGATQELGEVVTPVFPDTSTEVNLPGVWSLMNLAYAAHEIISDYVSVGLIWFESGTKEDVGYLMDWYTYGLPPPPASPPPPAPLPLPKKIPSALQQSSVPVPSPAPMPPPRAAQPPSGVTASKSTDSGASPAAAPESGASRGGGGMSSSTIAIIAGAVGGAVAVLLIAGLTWCCLRRRRAQAALEAAAGSGGYPPATKQAMHMDSAPHAGASAHVSIVPGVKERFEMAEVLEQTGSPYSARRRVRTAFQSDSPHKADAV